MTREIVTPGYNTKFYVGNSDSFVTNGNAVSFMKGGAYEVSCSGSRHKGWSLLPATVGLGYFQFTAVESAGEEDYVYGGEMVR